MLVAESPVRHRIFESLSRSAIRNDIRMVLLVVNPSP